MITVKADDDKREIIERSYKAFIKAYNNNPANTERYSIPIFINKFIKPKTGIESETPLKKFRNCQRIRIEIFLLFCEIFKLDPFEIVTDKQERQKLQTQPDYTPQTKTLLELKSRKRYNTFIGRDKEKAKIKEILESREFNRVIVVEGIGGSGKTSLVLKCILDFCSENTSQKDSENLIWLTAKPQEIIGNRLNNLTPAKISFETILNEVAVKLGVGGEIEVRENITQKKDFLRKRLGTKPYLIIVDNLETVENFRSLVTDLEDFFIYSKVLITTRESVPVSNYIETINIAGFQNKEDSIKFMQQFLETKPHAKQFLATNIKTLEIIHNKTGGLPLAMELIISQIEAGGFVDSTIKRLTSINFKSVLETKTDDQDIFNQFYRFIYEHSWNLLSEKDRDLLFLIAAEPIETGLYFSLAKDLAEDEEEDLEMEDLEISTKKLQQLNLIYFGFVEGEQSYFLHPLTHQFVNTHTE